MGSHHSRARRAEVFGHADLRPLTPREFSHIYPPQRVAPTVTPETHISEAGRVGQQFYCRAAISDDISTDTEGTVAPLMVRSPRHVRDLHLTFAHRILVGTDLIDHPVPQTGYIIVRKHTIRDDRRVKIRVNFRNKGEVSLKKIRAAFVSFQDDLDKVEISVHVRSAPDKVGCYLWSQY